MRQMGELSCRLEEAKKCRLGLHPARLAPNDKFSQVHPPVARLTIVDPGLRLAQPLTDFPLGETRLLSQGANEVWYGPVKPGMLGFRCHSRTIARNVLDTISVSSHAGYANSRITRERKCR